MKRVILLIMLLEYACFGAWYDDTTNNGSHSTVMVDSDNSLSTPTNFASITLGGVTRSSWIDPTSGIDKVAADQYYASWGAHVALSNYAVLVNGLGDTNATGVTALKSSDTVLSNSVTSLQGSDAEMSNSVSTIANDLDAVEAAYITNIINGGISGTTSGDVSRSGSQVTVSFPQGQTNPIFNGWSYYATPIISTCTTLGVDFLITNGLTRRWDTDSYYETSNLRFWAKHGAGYYDLSASLRVSSNAADYVNYKVLVYQYQSDIVVLTQTLAMISGVNLEAPFEYGACTFYAGATSDYFKYYGLNAHVKTTCTYIRVTGRYLGE